MRRFSPLLALVLALVSVLVSGLVPAGCLSELRTPSPSPYAVLFRLEPAEARTPGRVAWLATYEKGGSVARFRIEMQPEPVGTRLPTFIRCALLREPGSDGSAFLEELAAALDGRVPPVGPGVAVIEASAALLGRDLSRGGSGNIIAGSFGSEPRGDWISTKLFLGEAQSEVFLNLDPVGGYGELSTKDPAYGDDVLRELGRLFQGEVQATALEPAAPEAPTRNALPPEPHPAPASRLSDRDAARIAAWIDQARHGEGQPERREALQNLTKMGARAHDAVPAFLEALEDDDPLIRADAVLGLPQLRPDPQLGIAAVTPLLKDSYDNNQVWAANALAEFGDTTTAVAHLTLLLTTDTKVGAAAGLARLGPAAKGAVPLLTEMLEKRRDHHEGYAAAMALGAIGREAQIALPALRRAAEDPNSYVSKAAAYAIKEIEPR